jgi:phenolic acid decarboxylase
MTSIQQLQEHIKRLNDERLLNQYDIYNSYQIKEIKEVIYQRLVECELDNRRLLTHKIMEDDYEYAQ